MSSLQETGHAMNAASLLNLNQFIGTLGATYNPSIQTITLPALGVLQTNAVQKILAVKTWEDRWKIDTNSREAAFENLGMFSTRLLSALKATDASWQTIEDFTALVHKLRGKSKRKTAKKTGDIKDNADEVSLVEAATRSTSQQSFDQKMEHFSKMILLLKGVASYAPNEADLQIEALENQLNNLILLNEAANNAAVKLKSARIDRNTFMYASGSGMLTIVKKAKDYIVSLYGKSSQQAKTATGFKFSRLVAEKNAK